MRIYCEISLIMRTWSIGWQERIDPASRRVVLFEHCWAIIHCPNGRPCRMALPRSANQSNFTRILEDTNCQFLPTPLKKNAQKIDKIDILIPSFPTKFPSPYMFLVGIIRNMYLAAKSRSFSKQFLRWEIAKVICTKLPGIHWGCPIWFLDSPSWFVPNKQW